MSEAEVERIGKALADPRRRELLEIVAKNPGLPCGELVARLGVSQPTISHHVGLLFEAELLDGVRDGKSTRLSARKDTISSYLSEISSRLAI